MLLMADTHGNPGDNLVELYGHHTGKLRILGDVINILPYGMARWNTPEGLATLASVGDMAPEVEWICGNHDPFNLVKKLPLPENVFIFDKIETKHALFTHGHRFTYWGLLSKFAPQLCDFLEDKNWWHKFCQWKGWSGSHHNMKAGMSKEIMIGLAECIGWCEKHKKNLYVGHFHAFDYFVDERDTYILQALFVSPIEVEE